MNQVEIQALHNEFWQFRAWMANTPWKVMTPEDSLILALSELGEAADASKRIGVDYARNHHRVVTVQEELGDMVCDLMTGLGPTYQYAPDFGSQIHEPPTLLDLARQLVNAWGEFDHGIWTFETEILIDITSRYPDMDLCREVHHFMDRIGWKHKGLAWSARELLEIPDARTRFFAIEREAMSLGLVQLRDTTVIWKRGRKVPYWERHVQDLLTWITINAKEKL